MIRYLCCAALLLMLRPAAADAVTDEAWAVFETSGDDRSIKIHVTSGIIVVDGGASDTVFVSAMPLSKSGATENVETDIDPRAAGLRKITHSATGLEVRTDDELMTIRTEIIGGAVFMHVRAPRDVALDISSEFAESILVRHMQSTVTVKAHSTVQVENTIGSLEIESVSDWIRLIEVSGSVVASTQFGAIEASFTSIDPERPTSLSAVGTIDVALPQDIAATLHLKTTWGEIFSDFDMKILPRWSGRSAPEGPSTVPGVPHVTPAPPPAKSSGEAVPPKAEAPSVAPAAPTPDRSVIRAEVGGGGVEIRLVTASGNIYVRKRR